MVLPQTEITNRDMTGRIELNRKHCAIVCPKCGQKTWFDMQVDAIDEQGEFYRCRQCGWPFW